MPVWRAKEEVPSSEFVRWCVWLLQEETRHKAIDFQMAMLTAEVRRSYVLKPREVRTEHFLLKYDTPKPASDTSQEVNRSKQFWLSKFGIKE